MHAASKDITLRLEVSPDDATAVIDARKMMQALNNLIANAVKFSAVSRTVVIRGEADQAVARFVVADEGPGISEEARARLFMPFKTGAARGTAGEKSTGLGLAIVKKVVEAHRGTVTIDSELGHGSRFVIEIPQPAPTA